MIIGIVAVGYNRKESLTRLLTSICAANTDSQCDLIISLDKSDVQDELVEIAKKCSWPDERKIILVHKERLKLKNHVLSCGDLTEKYDAVIVLEDDIVVSKYFYVYALEAIQKYGKDTRIAGISLYSHKTNVEVMRPFHACESASDVYLLRFPQSWGQCWTRSMWRTFREWLAHVDDSIFASDLIPDNVKTWGNQSWLKYQVAYCALEKKYYIYPYVSLSTNYTEKGTHNDALQSTAYQVPLQRFSKTYQMDDFENLVRYDAFFEREDDVAFSKERLFRNQSVCMNLYGYKKSFGKCELLASSQNLNYEVVQELQLLSRPHEMNLIDGTEGAGIFIYDLKSPKSDKTSKKNNRVLICEYDMKSYNAVALISYILNVLWTDIRTIIHNKLKRKK